MRTYHWLGNFAEYNCDRFFDLVVGHFFERVQLSTKGLAFVKGFDFYGRMLVEWMEASGTLDAGFLKHMGVGCQVWPCVRGCGLVDEIVALWTDGVLWHNWVLWCKVATCQDS